MRFSTVQGPRGSAGYGGVTCFAVKFYTDEGNFDLVGKQHGVLHPDAIKFPTPSMR